MLRHCAHKDAPLGGGLTASRQALGRGPPQRRMRDRPRLTGLALATPTAHMPAWAKSVGVKACESFDGGRQSARLDTGGVGRHQLRACRDRLDGGVLVWTCSRVASTSAWRKLPRQSLVRLAGYEEGCTPTVNPPLLPNQ
jgi:hypothetical protein